MINAFRQIRLTNSLLTVTGTGVLQVGSEQVVYKSQTGQFYPNGQNPSGYIGSSQTGLFYPASNPSGFITAAQAGGVQSLSVSGASVSGIITFTGINGVVVSTGVGSTIRIDGGNFITSSQTGQFYPNGQNPSGYVMSTQTGGFVTTAQTGQFVWTGSQQSFTTSITTGIDNQFISFPVNFGSTPKVQVSVETTGDIMYGVAIRGRTVSGFTSIFSDIIQESGVVLHTFATL